MSCVPTSLLMFFSFLALFVCVFSSVAHSAPVVPPPTELYLSPAGNDAWSGSLPAPNRASSDGPLATFPGALARLRALKAAGTLQTPVTVYVRAGVYRLAETLRITPDDPSPLTFAAFKNERPVIDGSSPITNWAVSDLNGRPVWVADLPDVAAGKWNFRSLYVNGLRAPRPRLPKDGLFHISQLPGLKLPAKWGDPAGNTFVAVPDNVRPFHNLSDVEVVALHFWVEERSTIAAFDPDTFTVTLARTPVSALVATFGSERAPYYLDNVFEALSEPGQWYLDRPAGKLFYLPAPGQTLANTEISAPRLLQLVTLIGRPDANRFVENVHFRGLAFSGTDWRHPGEETKGLDPDTGAAFSRGNSAAAGQAANDVPGVLRFIAARNCSVERCTFQGLGWYAVDIGSACSNIDILHNTIRDLGAGGVKINGASAAEKSPDRETHHVSVSDNEISQCGRVFHSAVGVLSMHAHHVAISHNHIHDLFYTAVSCGWVWGYADSASHDNTIEFNNLHDIGQGLLSDMGGIYTLGPQSGTVIRNNLIHDIHSARYGGWCIYPDEGSSNMLIENNVCYDADNQPFHQHYGRENLVRNNIFAFGGMSAALYTRLEPHVGLTFERNILVTEGNPPWGKPRASEMKPLWVSSYSPEEDAPRYKSDFNLLWDVAKRPPAFRFKIKNVDTNLSLEAWRAFGHETHSLVADPLFRNLAKRDFTLLPTSPAFKLGFKPIDLSTIGPRK